MQVLGNRVFVKQGESFTLRFGDTENVAPLIITSALRHPFITVELKSTTYPQKGQNGITKWLNCKDVPRFKEARIMYLGSGTISDVELPDDDVGPVDGVFKRVYAVEVANGEFVYFYLADNEERVQYSFKFKVVYSRDESIELVNNEYIGGLSLVDGQTLKEQLRQLCANYKLTPSVNGMSNMLQALRNINAPELETLDTEMPLSLLTLNVPLYQFKIFVEA